MAQPVSEQAQCRSTSQRNNRPFGTEDLQGPRGSAAINPDTGPGWYEWHVLPYLIDIACGIKAVRRQREKVVPLARGQVLEIGIGTGLNLEHYDKARVERIVGLDPGLQMHRLARKRVARSGKCAACSSRARSSSSASTGSRPTLRCAAGRIA